MVRINWTLQSKSDLKQIADYISLNSKRYAKLQVLRIKTKTHILRTHILIGKVVREIEDENIRELIEGRYRIIYKVISKTRVYFNCSSFFKRFNETENIEYAWQQCIYGNCYFSA